MLAHFKIHLDPVSPGVEFFGLYLSSGFLWGLGILGGVFTLFVSIYLPILIAERRRAKSDFVNAFDTVLLNLQENQECMVAHLAYSEHSNIVAAVDRHRKHIPWYKRKRFEKDFVEYKKIQQFIVNDGGVFAAVMSEDNEQGQRKRVAYTSAVQRLVSYGT